MAEIVLITGCSSGIGLATAKHLASDPLKRFLVYATILQPLDEEETFRTTMSDVLDVTAFAIQMDITDEEMVVRAVSRVLTDHGRIDILINVPGVNNINVTEAISSTTMKQVFDINFFGMARVTQQVLPVMKRQRSGRIINMGSIHGILAFPYYAIYGASKQAAIGFCQEVATICRFFNVWVSVIEPGYVDTDINANMKARGFGGIEATRDKPDTQALDRKLSLCYDYPDAYGAVPPGASAAQQPEDIARLILEVATAEKPHFRYQTTPAARELAGRFLKDITGDDVIDRQEAELRKFLAHPDVKDIL